MKQFSAFKYKENKSLCTNYRDTLERLCNNRGNETYTRQGGRNIVLPGGAHLVYHMDNGFPLITTKKISFKSVWAELEWMLSGERSINRIMVEKHGVKFWQPWAFDESGDIGPGYPVQMRNWNEDNIDQIKNAQDMLLSNPESRRNLICLWNPRQNKDMALPPCHFAHQYVVDDEGLSLHFFMRSWDFFVGAPFNIAFYALMLHLMAKTVDIKPHLVVAHGSHVHLYNEHYIPAQEQLTRRPYVFPELEVKVKKDNLWEYEIEDVNLKGYKHHGRIKAKIHV